jgi:PTS system fructose-specific IIC component
MSELITPALVRLDAALGSDKHEVIRALANVVAEAGRSSNGEGLAEDALAR